MPSHTRRGAFGTTVCVGFLLDPRYADGFVLADAVRRMDLSVKDSMKLGELLLALAVAMGAVGEMSCCGSTGCLSCRGKQSTSSSLSSSGLSFLFLLLCADCFGRVLFGVGLRGTCVGLCA